MSKEAYLKQASTDYWDGQYARAAEGYRPVLTLTDSLEERIDRLREQASAYGNAGDYERQMQRELQALRLAQQHGLDSLERMARLSVGSIYEVCRRDTFECQFVRPPPDSSVRRASGNGQGLLSKTAFTSILLALSTFVFVGLLYLVFATPPQGREQTQR